MTNLVVDFPKLQAAIDHMAAFKHDVTETLESIDQTMTQLHSSWHGSGSDAQAHAQRQWEDGAEQMQTALSKLQKIAETAQKNYKDAVDKNGKMWGVVTSTVGSATPGDRIDVDPEVLLRAGKKIGAVGTQLGMLCDALGSALSSGIASGMDPAGLNFGLKYGHQAQEFADTLAKAANSFKAVGYMLEATGCNYRNADAASTVGGPGPSGGVGPQPAETTPAHVSPGPNSSIVPPPLKWSLIEPFLFAIPGLGMIAGAAMTWPSGNPAMMRLTAAQWRNFATGLSAFDDDIAATKTAMSVLHIPEGTKIGEALEDLGTALTGLSGLCSSVAQSVEGFARGVQETQDAIRRMLDRLSVDGLWDTVKGFLSGDGEKILREIAHDIGALLNNFQQLVKGYVGLLDELIGLLGDAATAFEKWIRPILVAQFGDRIGGALASAVTLYTDFEVGVASGLIGTVSGVVSMLDPDTWKGMAELAVSVAADPSKLPGVLENMGKQFVAWDKWSGDHPGRAAGEAAFNVASLFVPGGALSKTGTVAKGLKFTKGLLEEGKLGQLGKLSELSSKTSKLDGLEDLSRVGPKVPEVPEIKPTPGIPEAVVSPRLPDAFDTPPSPHGLERPSGPPDPPDPPGPTGTRGDHGAGSGDHPPPDPPGRANGPSEPGPGRVDGPTAQPPASAGPVDAPRAQEPSAPGHTTSPGDQAAPGAHTPESTSPPGTHDEGRPPSEHGQPSTDHDGATPETHNNGPVTDDRGHSPGLSDGTGHPPNETHAPSSGEERVHTPTDHQPAHAPDTPHNGHERTTTDGSHTSEPSRGDGNTGRHDPGPVTPVGMPVGGTPPAAHAPGIPHTPAESLGAAGKTPEAPTRNPETKAPQGTSPESARTQSPATSGPAPGSTPAAPVKPAAGHPEVGAASHTPHSGPESHAPRPGDQKRDGSRPSLAEQETPGGEKADRNPSGKGQTRAADTGRAWPIERHPQWDHAPQAHDGGPRETRHFDHGTHHPNDGPTAENIGPDGRYKLSGHGTWREMDGYTKVPENTTVTVYAEHGAQVSKALGNLIEAGGDTSRFFSRTYYPGEEIPNYSLLPPDDIKVEGTPYTVDKRTLLSDLIRADMGNVDFAACLGNWVEKVYDVDRIYDPITMHTIERYEPKKVDEYDDW